MTMQKVCCGKGIFLWALPLFGELSDQPSYMDDKLSGGEGLRSRGVPPPAQPLFLGEATQKPCRLSKWMSSRWRSADLVQLETVWLAMNQSSELCSDFFRFKKCKLGFVHKLCCEHKPTGSTLRKCSQDLSGRFHRRDFVVRILFFLSGSFAVSDKQRKPLSLRREKALALLLLVSKNN